MSYLLSKREYTDFDARFEFMMAPNSDSGFVFRAVPGDPMHHMEVTMNNFAQLNMPMNRHILWSIDATRRKFPMPPPDMRPDGRWNDMRIEVRGDRLRMRINGKQVQDTDLSAFKQFNRALSGLERHSGRIGLQAHSGMVRFRNAEIRAVGP